MTREPPQKRGKEHCWETGLSRDLRRLIPQLGGGQLLRSRRKNQGAAMVRTREERMWERRIKRKNGKQEYYRKR